MVVPLEAYIRVHAGATAHCIGSTPRSYLVQRVGLPDEPISTTIRFNRPSLSRSWGEYVGVCTCGASLQAGRPLATRRATGRRA